MQFDQSSPVQPNPEKNLKILLEKMQFQEIQEISLRPELSSQTHFRIQGGGGLSMTNGEVGTEKDGWRRMKGEGRKSFRLI